MVRTVYHAAHACLLACACVLSLRTQSIPNEHPLRKLCDNAAQLRVPPQGLLEVTQSDVLCGDSEGGSEETPSKQRGLEKATVCSHTRRTICMTRLESR